MTSEESGWEPTEAQLELIRLDETRLVEACPGAGKTRAIVARYKRVTASGGRKGVALLSFTNAAIDEVRQRCSDHRSLLSPNFVGTFDSFINRFVTGPAMASEIGKFPRFCDSWASINAGDFRFTDMVRGVEFNLDQFDWDDQGHYRFHPDRASGQWANALRSYYESLRASMRKRAPSDWPSVAITGS